MKKIKSKIVQLLLWSQKYTKADMLYLARSGSWVMFGQVLNSVLSFALIIAFANLLPKETYGIYKYILSIVGVLNIFTLTGMNSAVARAVAKGQEGVLIPAVIYQLKWNLLMLGGSFILSGYYFIKGDTILATSLLILGLFVPFTLAFNTYGSYFEGKKRFGTANILSVLSTFTYSAGTLVILLCTENVVWIILTYAVTTFVPSFIFYVYTIRSCKLQSDKDIEDTKQYGRELTYLRFIDPIISQIDKLILGSFWGAGQLAIYSLATAIPAQVSYFLKDWVAVGLPKFSEKTPSAINTVFYKRVFQGMGLGLLITLPYIFVSPYIFKYVLPQYLDSIFYSQLLSLNFIFAIPNRYISLLFVSQKFSRILFKRTFIQSLINVTLYILFGIFGGLLGLVIANVLISICGFFLNIFLWRKISNS